MNELPCSKTRLECIRDEVERGRPLKAARHHSKMLGIDDNDWEPFHQASRYLLRKLEADATAPTHERPIESLWYKYCSLFGEAAQPQSRSWCDLRLGPAGRLRAVSSFLAMEKEQGLSYSGWLAFYQDLIAYLKEHLAREPFTLTIEGYRPECMVTVDGNKVSPNISVEIPEPEKAHLVEVRCDEHSYFSPLKNGEPGYFTTRKTVLRLPSESEPGR